MRPSAFGRTKGEARRRARLQAAELIRANGSGSWRLGDSLTEYIEQVTKPALAKADLKDLSRERYNQALKFLLGDCNKCKRAGRRHQCGINQHTIGSGTTPKALEDLFTEIQSLHGYSTLKSCRTVWNKYIASRLMRDGLLATNPVANVRITDLTGQKKPERTRGGRAASKDEYEGILQWLLDADPADWPVSHRNNQWIWSPEKQIAVGRNAVDLTLLQMTTGLRQSEARGVEWPMCQISLEGVMSINVPEHVAKGGHPRVVLVLDQRVVKHLDLRRKKQNGEGFIVGTPTDPMKVWYRSSCVAAIRKLYERMAEETGIELLADERSHLWRTTLRSFYEGRVPEAVLNSQFGHSTEVAQLYYTDASDLSGLVGAAGLRGQ